MNDKPDKAFSSFLGSGWSFPPEFARNSEPEFARIQGVVLMRSDEEDIEESLKILFGTANGERFLTPKYGIDMHELVFEPLSTTMKTYLEDKIRTAILIYEPRIKLLSLELDTSAQEEGKISIVVEYQVRTTNSRYNLVYPFYITDSSEVRATSGGVPKLA